MAANIASGRLRSHLNLWSHLRSHRHARKMATNASPTQARAARVKEAVAGAKAQPPQPGFTEQDQVKRFAGAKEAGDVRVLDIDQVYDPSWMEGARVLITGANRGIGLGLAKEAAR